MDLQRDGFNDGVRIAECRADGLRINARWIRHSILLSANGIEQRLDMDSVTALADHTCAQTLGDQLLALNPELVLLGSGERIQFPPPAFQARLLQRGIGLETMDNAACARTFNLLAGEGRQVLAAILIPSTNSHETTTPEHLINPFTE